MWYLVEINNVEDVFFSMTFLLPAPFRSHCNLYSLKITVNDLNFFLLESYTEMSKIHNKWMNLKGCHCTGRFTMHNSHLTLSSWLRAWERNTLILLRQHFDFTLYTLSSSLPTFRRQATKIVHYSKEVGWQERPLWRTLTVTPIGLSKSELPASTRKQATNFSVKPTVFDTEHKTQYKNVHFTHNTVNTLNKETPYCDY